MLKFLWKKGIIKSQNYICQDVRSSNCIINTVTSNINVALIYNEKKSIILTVLFQFFEGNSIINNFV
jgi:hypothetical protein